LRADIIQIAKPPSISIRHQIIVARLHPRPVPGFDGYAGLLK
jgi:hypothetical protein